MAIPGLGKALMPPSGPEALRQVSLPANATPINGPNNPTINGADNSQPDEGGILGWRNFIQRVQTDPDLRVALMSAAAAGAQPASTGPETVGRALQAGVGTLQALQDRRFDQAQQTRETELLDRRTNVEEGELALRESALEQEGSQFEKNQQLAREELAARLEDIRGENEYRRALTTLRQKELNNTALQGDAFNRQWSRLRDILLQVQPERFGDGENARANAEAYAFDLLRGDQNRAELHARLMGDQALFLPVIDANPTSDPERYRQQVAEYQQEFQQRDRQVQEILDAAGLSNQTAFPGPRAGNNAAGAPPADPGTTSSTLTQGTQLLLPDGAAYTIDRFEGDVAIIRGPSGQEFRRSLPALEQAIQQGAVSVQ